jgi:hypothetical protein
MFDNKKADVEGSFDQVAAGIKKTFDVNIDTTENGKQYNGKIVFRMSNVKDEIERGVYEAKLRDGLPAASFDDTTVYIQKALSAINILTIMKPKWLDNMEEVPTQVIMRIYERYLSLRNEFFRSNDKPNGEDA